MTGPSRSVDMPSQTPAGPQKVTSRGGADCLGSAVLEEVVLSPTELEETCHLHHMAEL